jgi:hypothetical protein
MSTLAAAPACRLGADRRCESPAVGTCAHNAGARRLPDAPRPHRPLRSHARRALVCLLLLHRLRLYTFRPALAATAQQRRSCGGAERGVAARQKGTTRAATKQREQQGRAHPGASSSSAARDRKLNCRLCDWMKAMSSSSTSNSASSADGLGGGAPPPPARLERGGWPLPPWRPMLPASPALRGRARRCDRAPHTISLTRGWRSFRRWRLCAAAGGGGDSDSVECFSNIHNVAATHGSRHVEPTSRCV